MNSTAQPARDPQAQLPTGPTHVAARTRTSAPGAWKPTDRWDWACGLPVSGIGRAVANCIARHANDKTGRCWPGMGTIATETGFCRRAVVKAIKELERGGHVTVSRFKVGKKNRANRYQLPPMGSAPDALGGSAPDALGGSAPDALGGSAPDALGGSAPDALGGSAPDAPESVSNESVHESVSSSRARVVCEVCKHDWPASYGTNCHKCNGSSTKQPAKTEKPDNDPPLPPDGYRGTRIRNCPQCHTDERGYEDVCQYCNWTREKHHDLR